jgi:hypothetical protein
MHWELTPIVLTLLLAYGLYQSLKDLKTAKDNPPTEPDHIQDHIQDHINSGAAYMTADVASETALPAAVHLVETIAHSIHL